MVVKLVAGLCHLSFAVDAVCNSSRNANRSDAGQQVYVACWHEPSCDDSAAASTAAGLNSLEWVVFARTGQGHSAT